MIAYAKDLTPDESAELEDDVLIATQWLPQQLMSDLASWVEEKNGGTTDDEEALTQMVSWLAFLRIFDTAASQDSLNRAALTSYASKCQSVKAVLATALNYANIGSDNRKVKADPVVQMEQMFRDRNLLEVSKVASLVIFRTVEVLPALTKQFWEMDCPKYFVQPLSNFVESLVAPEILQRELERIQRTSSFGEMTVTGSSITREVKALYIQDDFTLTVSIRLPPSFPFRSAEVDCSKSLGVQEKRWKRWSLQITMMLNQESGKLGDALILWKENVDKEFEGVEPCPVCYSVLHVKTHKLPELECKTCSNRFHYDCLTQWFRSSGKSACVLCQQPWSGTRVN